MWLLNPNFQSEDIELTLTFRKYMCTREWSYWYQLCTLPNLCMTFNKTLQLLDLYKCTHDRKPHPVLLRYFVLHGLHHNPSNSTHQHLFAAVSWLKIIMLGTTLERYGGKMNMWILTCTFLFSYSLVLSHSPKFVPLWFLDKPFIGNYPEIDLSLSR